jgi:ADP-dependent phosphofructokinase/glucokinase
MEISSSTNSVKITGNIKSVADFQSVKRVIDEIVKTNKSVTINIPDSLSMTSSVIGYLNKLILKDNIDVSMTIGNARLIELLADLNLASTFKVRKV